LQKHFFGTQKCQPESYRLALFSHEFLYDTDRAFTCTTYCPENRRFFYFNTDIFAYSIPVFPSDLLSPKRLADNAAFFRTTSLVKWHIVLVYKLKVAIMSKIKEIFPT
jgi:hypothetical protein